MREQRPELVTMSTQTSIDDALGSTVQFRRLDIRLYRKTVERGERARDASGAKNVLCYIRSSGKGGLPGNV